MARIRADFVSGTVEGGDLAAAGTTLTSVGLADLPEVTVGNDAVIILDPEGQQNGPSVVYVTAHAPGATTATITAPGALHPEGTPWEHGPLAEDFVDDPDNVSMVGHTHTGEFAETVHGHDDLYYTEGEVDTALALKSDTTHNHDAAYSDVNHGHTDYADVGHTHDDLAAPEPPRIESIFVPGTLAAKTIKRVATTDFTPAISRIEVTLATAPVGADAANCLQVGVRGASHGEGALLLDGSGDLGGRHYRWATETPVIGGAQTDESGQAEGADNVVAMATKVSMADGLFVRAISFHLARNLTDATDPSLDGVPKRAVIVSADATTYIATGEYVTEPIPNPDGWMTFPIAASLDLGVEYWVGCEIASAAEDRVVRFLGAVSPTASVWTGVLQTYVGDADSRLFLTTNAPSTNGPIIDAVTTNDNAMAMRLHSVSTESAIGLVGDHIDISLDAVGTPPADPGTDAQIDVGLAS